MLFNDVKIALRRMRRHLGFTAINVTGLAVGLAVCAWIGLYISDEFSYDTFHPEGDRLYRVVTDVAGQDRIQQVGLSPQPAGPLLERDRSDVSRAVRLHDAQEPTVRVETQHHRGRRFFHAEPAFFEVFGFSLRRGDPEAALNEPRSVVLTEGTAEVYFGGRNPMGRTLVVDGVEYTVTGVVTDPPAHTHLQFDGLFSYASLSESYRQSWGNINAYTYVVLAKNADPQAFEQRIADLVRQETGGLFGEMTTTLRTQPVPDIHLHSDRRYDLSASGDIRTVFLFSSIAVLVLLIACINFMNLATARSMGRAREVGVRKAVGATRRSLAGQFLAESVVTVLFASMVAIGLVAVGLPFVNAITGKTLTLDPLATPGVIVGALGGAVVVGLAAGSYPALVLSRFRPARVLKGVLHGSPKGRRLRQGLVVVQFVVAIILLIGVSVVLRQFNYMQNHNLGFQGERVLVADLRVLPAETVAQQYSTIKQELTRHPGIQTVSVAGGVPGRHVADGILVYSEGLPPDETRDLRRYSVDGDYLDVLDLEVVAGRGFRAGDRGTEDPRPILVNETAVQALGWDAPETAVGKTIRRSVGGGLVYRIVGVIEDYHHFSLRQPIEPMFLRMDPDAFAYAVMQTAPGQVSRAVEHLRQTWEDLYAAYPSEHFFLDADFARQYRAEQRLAVIFGGFAGLALFVACLGLFGLAAFTVQQREKEISVRKVLGATVHHLVGLVSKDFARLVAVAFVLAAPVAYWAAGRWLDAFAYRIDLGPWVFLGAGVLAFVVALATVSTQALRAAQLDPARSLRSE